MLHCKRIVLAGSSGGGKTTLAELMGARWKTRPLTYSRPTAAANRMGFAAAREVPTDVMTEFQWEALIEQIKAEATRDYFVADRGTVDFAAYYLFQAPGAQLDDPYVRVAMRHALSYDKIIVVPPPSGTVEDNGRRHLHGVWDVHDNLMGLLKLHDLEDRTIVLSSDGPENRYQEVMERLFGADARA